MRTWTDPLVAVVAALLLIVPGALAGSNGTYDEGGYGDGYDSEECRRWATEEFPREQRRFHEQQARKWHRFVDNASEAWQRFVRSEPTEEEIRQFKDEWRNRTQAKADQLREEWEAHVAKMRQQWREHCGSAEDYDPTYPDYGFEEPPWNRTDDGWTYGPECASWDRQRFAEARNLSEEHREEWRAFQDRWEQRFENASGSNATAEEMRDLHEQRARAAQNLTAEHRREWRKLTERYPDRSGCIPPAHRDVPDDRPGSCSFEARAEAIRAAANERREAAERFHEILRRKVQEHLADRRDHHREIVALLMEVASDGNVTDAEEQRLRDELGNASKDHAAFAHELAKMVRSYQDRQRRDVEQLIADLREECTGRERPRPVPQGQRMHEEMRRCMLDARARTEAKMAQGNASQAELRAEMRAAVEECKGRVHAGAVAEASGRPEDRIGSWNMTFHPDHREIHLAGRYVSLSGDPETNTMHDVSIRGQVYIETLATTGHFASDGFRMGEADRSWLEAEGDGIRMRLHDSPTGLIKADARDEALLLTIPEALAVRETADGWTIGGEGAASAQVRAENGSWDDGSRILELHGAVTFLVPRADNPTLPTVANRHRSAIGAAVASGAVGGEVTVVASAQGGSLDEALAYADVNVSVSAATGDGRVEVTFASETLTEGRTFVVNVEDDLVSLGDELRIRYESVDEETGEAHKERIERADSLQDVLDPSDDDGPEYWIVEDADGVQVLVSIPHWSIHRVSIQSVKTEAENLLPAPGSIVAVAVLAAAALAVVRRSRD